ncbi:MAG: putative peroxiredoxin bcp [Myxococcota bacterium]|nr:putative peroxiredoxin bcp [Myxococcota bacterium]
MLEAGKKIPRFQAPDQDGKKRGFADLTGEKGAVIYFYPKDNTPGCTIEAQEFRDRLDEIHKLGFTVVGVSRDSQKSHCGFIEKHRLNFPLLSDEDGKVCEAFGAWGEKNMYGKKVMGIIRSTFVIGKDGKVLKAWPKVSVKGHVDDVVNSLSAL